MTKTENYGLSQWEFSDRVLMDDFNADNQKIDDTLTAIATKAGNCHIVTGSYIGIGKYGGSNPNSLTFDGKPLVVFVNGNFNIVAISPAMAASSFSSYGTNQYYGVYLTWSDNGLSWYHTSQAMYQLNENGQTYYYTALITKE